jgi:hypothetical protein
MNMRKTVARFAVLSMSLLSAHAIAAQTVVFSQSGFPTVDSVAVPMATLNAALGVGTSVLNVEQLRDGDWPATTHLLVLPYGSAFPAEAWPSILRYLKQGGNLLILGGQPFRVPVLGTAGGGFVEQSAQHSYSRGIDIRHSYEVPLGSAPLHFHWRAGYEFLTRLQVKAAKVFAEEGRLQGLGYLDEQDGTHLAAPVIVLDQHGISSMAGSRIVALPFVPTSGYWASSDGTQLIRAAAHYAQAGATSLQIETQYATLRPGEVPELTVHLRRRQQSATDGIVDAQLLMGDKVLEKGRIALTAEQNDAALPFHTQLPTGLYTVRATWSPFGSTAPQEFAENGFQVEDLSAIESGDSLGVSGDFLTLGGKPFLPVGTNYFTTEENGWDFSGPRNAAVWERDFADMQRHGVNFVRTGVWMSPAKFLQIDTGAVSERFLRNLEAYLAAAHRHSIAVNFTFFAFTPSMTESRKPESERSTSPPPSNPYLDRTTLDAERRYVASVVQRFGSVPWLSYDLINEPSFSNPRSIFHGNLPNGDPVELAAWGDWLQRRYSSLYMLADAWRTTTSELGGWQSIPLPRPADLVCDRYGNGQQVRALDYNLFAQEMFSNWVRMMASTIHKTGSRQLINVGQDEGGVTNRLLNQFYATAGVSFTTNHTYWQDDALLWDSVAAKRPGVPNITGETGYQPAWNPDGAWRYDELTGSGIEERKLALGFAAGSSGALQWDWAREPDFGMQRSDGSAKVWESMMRELGEFATQAAPYATGITFPDVAVVLPQSLQMSTRNGQAVQAQQTAVRVLYQEDRVEAYAVGEYQIDTLGKPKLILLPSPFGLTDAAWAAIEARVRDGAVLLISGPFSEDEHMHATDRAQKLGLDATLVPLQLRDELLHSPAGDLSLEYGGTATTVLDRSRMADGKEFVELLLGKGKVLFSVFPLELNGDTASIARVYEYAIKAAGVSRTYTTSVANPGILICPTRMPHSTLYVLTSETETTTVSFTDTRSGKLFSGRLEAGRAALLLVGEHGDLIARYRWHDGGE